MTLYYYVSSDDDTNPSSTVYIAARQRNFGVHDALESVSPDAGIPERPGHTGGIPADLTAAFAEAKMVITACQAAVISIYSA